MIFYLSIAMEYNNGRNNDLRNKVSYFLEEQGHEFIDPYSIDQNEATNYLGLTDGRLLFSLKGHVSTDKLRAAMRFVAINDMKAVNSADCVILFYDEGVRKGAGSHAEAWEAHREGKPVYIVSAFPLTEVPSWLIAESTELFFSVEDLTEYLKDRNRLEEDVVRARQHSEFLKSAIQKRA